jgi:flagellar capping protein FliD
MKARGKNLVHVVMPVLVVCLLALTCTVYAAAATAQKSIQQKQSVTSTTSPTSIKYDPNAPPQGTITIPASSKGNVNASTWYTGSYQYIQWTCNGTYSNLVDVTLWQNNREVALIWSGATTGGTAYIVPFSTAAGNYELRVTSKDDTRVEARLPVTVAPTTVTLETPPGVLFAGSRYTINWSYSGNPTSVKLVILDSSGTVVQSVPNISIGSNGKGSWPLTVPAPTSGKSSVQCRFQIVGTFRTSVTSDAKADIVLGTSGLFDINLPTIRVCPLNA